MTVCFERKDHILDLSRRKSANERREIESKAADNPGNPHGLIDAYFQTTFHRPIGRKLTQQEIEEAGTDIAMYVISRNAGFSEMDRMQNKMCGAGTNGSSGPIGKLGRMFYEGINSCSIRSSRLLCGTDHRISRTIAFAIMFLEVICVYA